MSERIHKLLAHAGYGSRREIESWIRAGRIQINGKIAELGQQVDEKDKIKLDKKLLRLTDSKKIKHRILAFNKPVGVVCTRKDNKGRPTVFEYLPALKKQRWVSVGRLDINSGGLLLFTNNGDWANRLMHPSSNIEREYAVRVLGEVSNETLQNLRNGVMLEGKLARFTDIVMSGGKGANQWFHVVLMEGLNREVRRLWESQGLKVSRLIRVRYGSYILSKSKKPGDFWDLTDKETEQLLAFAATAQ